jgi:hypothetical protein
MWWGVIALALWRSGRQRPGLLALEWANGLTQLASASICAALHLKLLTMGALHLIAHWPTLRYLGYDRLARWTVSRVSVEVCLYGVVWLLAVVTRARIAAREHAGEKAELNLQLERARSHACLTTVPETCADAALQATQRQHLLLPERGGKAVVALSAICWIEAADDYVCVHTAAKQYLVRSTLRRFVSEVADSGVVQVHRSAAVSVQHIQRIEGSAIVLRSGQRVHASKTGVRALVDAMARHENRL